MKYIQCISTTYSNANIEECFCDFYHDLMANASFFSFMYFVQYICHTMMSELSFANSKYKT